MYELIGTKDGIEQSFGEFDTELDAETTKGSIIMDYEYDGVDWKIVPMIRV